MLIGHKLAATVSFFFPIFLIVIINNFLLIRNVYHLRRMSSLIRCGSIHLIAFLVWRHLWWLLSHRLLICVCRCLLTSFHFRVIIAIIVVITCAILRLLFEILKRLLVAWKFVSTNLLTIITIAENLLLQCSWRNKFHATSTSPLRSNRSCELSLLKSIRLWNLWELFLAPVLLLLLIVL